MEVRLPMERPDTRIGGLAIGVYNLCLDTSTRGNQFTAQAAEGVRVHAGEDASVDLELVKGRRVKELLSTRQPGSR
jgi:hypothetical protein